MFKDIKVKIILIILIVLAVVSCIYLSKKNKESTLEFEYNNIIETSIENTEENTIKEIEKEYIKIHITGQVKNSGVIELEYGSRISDAIEKAGGITELANLENVNLAYCLEDGQKICIPSKEEKNVEYIIEENGENIVQEIKNTSSNKKININKADTSELEEIPGIGPSMANKILNYRKENGKFSSIEDIKNVSGIGDKKFEAIKEYICVK